MVSSDDGVNKQADDAEHVSYGDGAFLFVGLLIVGIVVFVALLYGFFWLMFASGIWLQT